MFGMGHRTKPYQVMTPAAGSEADSDAYASAIQLLVSDPSDYKFRLVI
jgi:hypothetical protein